MKAGDTSRLWILSTRKAFRKRIFPDYGHVLNQSDFDEKLARSDEA
jgi:hypothetical protein